MIKRETKADLDNMLTNQNFGYKNELENMNIALAQQEKLIKTEIDNLKVDTQR